MRVATFNQRILIIELFQAICEIVINMSETTCLLITY